METRFENRKALNEKHFNRGWCVKLCPEGRGFAIRLAQFNGEIKMWFRFDLNVAENVFNQVCSFVKNPKRQLP